MSLSLSRHRHILNLARHILRSAQEQSHLNSTNKIYPIFSNGCLARVLVLGVRRGPETGNSAMGEQDQSQWQWPFGCCNHEVCGERAANGRGEQEDC